MIIEYNRPGTIDELVGLLSRGKPRTIVLGGGLYINEVIKDQVAVVDIQDLGLTQIKNKGKLLHLGAGVSLQNLVLDEKTPAALVSAIKYQENYNRRQIATLAGTLVAASGRSAVTAVMLALDAELHLIRQSDQEETIHLGDFLPLRNEKIKGALISEITIPANTWTGFNYVARSPGDLPIVAAAVSQWPSGRTRVTLAGFGKQPVLVLDGPNAEGAASAAQDAYSEAGDQWASAEYRSNTAAVLVNRLLGEIAEGKKGK